MLDKNNNYIKSVYNQEGDIETFLEENKSKLKENMNIFIFCHGKLIRKFLKIKKKNKNCSVFHITNQEDETFSIDDLSKKNILKLFFDQFHNNNDCFFPFLSIKYLSSFSFPFIF